MLFSDYFNVTKEQLEEYGAFNISLLKDNQLFIDPLLIYHAEDENIKNLYPKIVDYLLFLKGEHNSDEYDFNLDSYFCFHEIPYNWLGLAKKGNRGLALGREFAKELYNSIESICDNNEISKTLHVEKMYLIKEGVGKDKISDMVTNIIYEYILDYTSKFAESHIDKKYISTFRIDCSFDLETKTFVSKTFNLPFIEGEKGKEPVLLTPKCILRKGDQEINRVNFDQNFDGIVECIDNISLRTQINSLIKSTFKKMYDSKLDRIETITTQEIASTMSKAKQAVISNHPEIFDYFIREKENCNNFVQKAKGEVQYEEYLVSKNGFIEANVFNFSPNQKFSSSLEEAKSRIEFFKTRIENGGLWRNLYYNGEQIADERDLQRMFHLVWHDSKNRFAPETDSGVGPVDFEISLGPTDVTNIEFKLAANNKLAKVGNQIEAYRKANNAKHSIVVFFYFNQKEFDKAIDVSKLLDSSIIKYFINCDKDADEKKSASNQ